MRIVIILQTRLTNFSSLIQYFSQNKNEETALKQVDASLEVKRLVNEFSNFEFPQIDISKNRCEDFGKYNVVSALQSPPIFPVVCDLTIDSS